MRKATKADLVRAKKPTKADVARAKKAAAKLDRQIEGQNAQLLDTLKKLAPQHPFPPEIFREWRSPLQDIELVSLSVALAEQLKRGAPPEHRTLADLQEAYNRVKRKTGKRPSRRAVERDSGYARDTVRNHWSQLRDEVV